MLVQGYFYPLNLIDKLLIYITALPHLNWTIVLRFVNALLLLVEANPFITQRSSTGYKTVFENKPRFSGSSIAFETVDGCLGKEYYNGILLRL